MATAMLTTALALLLVSGLIAPCLVAGAALDELPNEKVCYLSEGLPLCVLCFLDYSVKTCEQAAENSTLTTWTDGVGACLMPFQTDCQNLTTILKRRRFSNLRLTSAELDELGPCSDASLNDTVAANVQAFQKDAGNYFILALLIEACCVSLCLRAWLSAVGHDLGIDCGPLGPAARLHSRCFKTLQSSFKLSM